MDLKLQHLKAPSTYPSSAHSASFSQNGRLSLTTESAIPFRPLRASRSSIDAQRHHNSNASLRSIASFPHPSPELQLHRTNARKFHEAASEIGAHRRPSLSLWALSNLQTIQFWSLRYAKDPLRKHRVPEERDQDTSTLEAQRTEQEAME